ncbi:peptidase, partial [[Clostridium] symbiosum]
CYTLDIADARTALSYEEYLTRWKSNARGVDLNHNFDAGWDTLNPTLNHNSFTDYKGPSPLSEPE